jgi:prepilin-type N-terminal cleavage/methylation domain-containing protein
MMRIRVAHLRGFTIVELLIVIVVIAILAAITVVAYNGITDRANDSARESAVSDLRKRAELYKVNSGTYGYGSTSILTRDDALSLYGIQDIADRVVICWWGNASCPATGKWWSVSDWDKTKVYIYVWKDEIDYSTWNRADNKWHNEYIFDEGSNYEDDTTATPLGR